MRREHGATLRWFDRFLVCSLAFEGWWLCEALARGDLFSAGLYAAGACIHSGLLWLRAVP